MKMLGKYHLLREVGRGGMGAVWEAEDPQLRRRVALKIVHEGETDPEFVARLHREAAIAAQLRHPNIVGIHEVGSDAGTHFIAMEFVDGQTLSSMLGKSPRAELLRILEETARAVGHAHAAGVIHRDLKPGNVMVDQGARVVLMDFGLARSQSFRTKLTASQTVVGTPQYMAPEQIAAGEVDARTDVYALGVMLYEILKGRPPFQAETPVELFHKILYEDPASLEAERDLVVICLKAMDKDRFRRYANAAEFAEDLARFRKGEPIVGRPPSLIYTLRKKLAKGKLAIGAVAAILLVATVLLWRVSAERARTLEQLKKRAASNLDAALEMRRAGQVDKMDRFARETEEACRETMREFPKEPEPHYHLGRMYRAQMKNDAALAEQEAALELDPAYAPSLYERVVLHTKRYWDRADQLVNDAWGAEGLALVRMDEGIRSAAFDRNDLIKNDPRLQELRKRIEEDLRKLDSSQECAQGLLAWVTGDIDGARRLLESAIAKTPTLEEAYEALGMIEVDQSRFAESVAWWERGIKVDQGYLPFLENRGTARLLWGISLAAKGEDPVPNYEASSRDLQAVLEREPARRNTRLRHGLAHVLLGPARKSGSLAEDIRIAEEDFTGLLESDPQDAEAWQWRGVVRTVRAWQAQLAGEDPRAACDQAAGDLEKALALRGGLDYAHFCLGLGHGIRAMYQVAGQLDPKPECRLAIEETERALQINPHRPETWVWRGIGMCVLAFYGDWSRTETMDLYRQGLECLDRGIGLAPERADGYMWRGLARTGEGRLLPLRREDPTETYRLAEADLDRAVKLGPRNALAWKNRGDLFEARANRTRFRGGDATADLKEALRSYEEAVRHDRRMEPGLKNLILKCRRLLGD